MTFLTFMIWIRLDILRINELLSPKLHVNSLYKKMMLISGCWCSFLVLLRVNFGFISPLLIIFKSSLFFKNLNLSFIFVKEKNIINLPLFFFSF